VGRTLTYNFWALLVFGLSGCGFISEQLSNTGGGGSSLPSLSDLLSEKVYINTTSHSLAWSASAGATGYQAKLYSGPGCSGDPLDTIQSINAQATFTSLEDSKSYSIGVLATNSAGNSAEQCSSEIVVDTQAPDDVSFLSPTVSMKTGGSNYDINYTARDHGLSGLATSDRFDIEIFDNASCSGSPSSTLKWLNSVYNLPLTTGTARSIRVRTRDRAGNYSNKVCSNSVEKDATVPVVILTDGTTSSNNLTDSTSVSLSISNDSTAAKWCISETQTSAPANGAAACTGGLGPASGWYTVEPTSFTLSASDGSKTIYVWIADGGDSIINASAGIGNITKDSTSPSVPTFTAPLASASITASTYTWLWSNSTDATSGLSIEQPYFAELFSGSSCSGSAIASGYQSTTEYNLTGITEGQSYSLRVKSLDQAGNESTTVCSATISRPTTGGGGGGGTAIGNPTLSLADATSASTATSNAATVNVTIGSDSTATKWCVSETQTSQPSVSGSCSGGSGSSAGWHTSRPSTFSLSAGDGTKTVYVWVANATSVSSSVSASILLDTTSPGAVSFTAPATNSSTTSNSYTFTWAAATDPGGANSSGLHPTTPYRIRTYSQASCAGGIGATSTSSAASFNYSGLTAYSVYSVSVTAIDAAENEGAATCSNSVTYAQNAALTLASVYTGNDNWLEYIHWADAGQDKFHQTNTKCTSANTGLMRTTCIHAGQVRKVAHSSFDSCTGLTATDSLGVFQWECQVEGGVATFYSYAFQTGKGLKDLITSTPSLAWRENQVTLTWNSYTVGQTGSVAWHTNDLEAPAANGDGVDSVVNLTIGASTDPKIYVVSSSTTTQGYNLNSDNLGFVTLPGVTLTYGGSASNNVSGVGETASPTAISVLASGYNNFLWIEANVNATAATVAGYGLYLGGWPKYVRVHNSSFANAATANIHDNSISPGQGHYYTDVTLSSSAGKNYYSIGASVELDNVTSSGSTGYSIHLATTSNANTSIIRNSTITGGSRGIEISGAGTSVHQLIDNTVSGATGECIYLNKIGNHSMTNNTVHSCGSDGFRATGQCAMTIENSTFYGNTNGARFNTCSGSSQPIIKNSTAYGNSGNGFEIWWFTANGRIENSISYSNGANGFQIGGTSSANWNVFGSRAYNNTGVGIYATANGFINEAYLFGNGSDGLEIDGADITASKITSVGNQGAGILVGSNAARATFNHAFLANNGHAQGNLYLYRSDYGTFNHIVSLNSTYGVYIGNVLEATGNHFYNSAFALNGTDVYVEVGGGTQFKGLWLRPASLTCGLGGTPGTNPGISNPGCANQGGSDATHVAIGSPATSFAGKVSVTDTSNGSNTNGTSALASITDWINFETLFRAFGKSGSAFANSDHRGRCSTGGETCQIWDWRLLSTDTVLLDKSEDGATANTFNGSDCPDAVDGDSVVIDQRTSAQTFLANAWEPWGDSSGDDDGICETGEICVYSPNFGAYQGHGDFTTQSCTQPSGTTVVPTTLFYFPTNGI